MKAVTEDAKTTFTIISLSKSESFTAKVARTLKQFLNNPYDYDTLFLDEQNITDSNCVCIAAALENNMRVGSCYLNNNKIGNRGATSLGAMLQNNNNLVYLNLHGNLIGDSGAKALGQGLENNRSLLCVYLTKNHINHDGAQAIAKGVTNNTLIRYCYLDYMATGNSEEPLKDLLKNTNLFFYLNGNLIQNKIALKYRDDSSPNENSLICSNSDMDLHTIFSIAKDSTESSFFSSAAGDIRHDDTSDI